jgi:glycosyltransferase involved in cell wall biosynthesis
MVIGIDASRAFLRNRTGIEEYAYQVISHLRDPLRDERVILYVREGQGPDFELPESWQVRSLRAPRFWTHLRLSFEMLLHRPDVLFIPAHTIPFVHPRRSVVAVHGLEYEFSRESYSSWERYYMRSVIRYSCYAAETIIAVSENTKRDLVRRYDIPERKVRVIYEGKPDRQITDNSEQITGGGEQSDGAISNFEFRILKREPEQKPSHGVPGTPFSKGRNGHVLPVNFTEFPTLKKGEQGGFDGYVAEREKKYIQDAPYLLFVGRIEERKNVRRIVEAFDILKRDRGISHRLILAGKPGFGYADVKNAIGASAFQGDIIETGYVSEEEKAELLRHADVFMFPSLYEGFGLPVVEAQAVGTPVVTSNVGSLPEIGGDGASYADPTSSVEIAGRTWSLLSDKVLRDGIMEKGRLNAERFDWGRCADAIAELLRK